MCCHDDTWFHLNLTFPKPWANQCIFLMDMFFFLSYVNELCIYPRLIQVGSVWLRNDLTNQCYPGKYSLKLCWWDYVFACKPAFLQDSCQSFYCLGQLCQGYLKMHVVGEGPSASLWVLRHFLSLVISLQNGNPLQRSCLENPRDRGTWWASVYGVAQSRTQLTRLSSSSYIRSG